MNVIIPTSFPEPAFETWKRIRVRALLLGKRIDLRAIQHGSTLSGTPAAMPAGEDGLAILFRYGAVVTFNLKPAEEEVFLSGLADIVGNPFATKEIEEAEIVIDSGTGPAQTEGVDISGNIRLGGASMDRLLVVADVLAKSVMLAYDEQRVAAVFDRIEPVAEKLHRPGRSVPVRELLGHIGDVLITEHRMVGRVEVTEKPELVWDRADLERLYVRLREEYDLPERDRALTRGLSSSRKPPPHRSASSRPSGACASSGTSSSSSSSRSS